MYYKVAQKYDNLTAIGAHINDGYASFLYVHDDVPNFSDSTKPVVKTVYDNNEGTITVKMYFEDLFYKKKKKSYMKKIRDAIFKNEDDYSLDRVTVPRVITLGFFHTKTGSEKQLRYWLTPFGFDLSSIDIEPYKAPQKFYGSVIDEEKAKNLKQEIESTK